MISETIENRTSVELPAELIDALKRWNGQYSEAAAVYNLVWLDLSHAVGTFGDGSMGCYEWFVWEDGKLRTSQKGYGNTVPALRDVLVEEYPA